MCSHLTPGKRTNGYGRMFTVIILTRVFVFAEQQRSVVAAFSGLLHRSGRRPEINTRREKKMRIQKSHSCMQNWPYDAKNFKKGSSVFNLSDTHHCPSSFSPLSPCTSASSHVGGSLTMAVLQGGVGAGGSLGVSRPTGKASTVRGGTVETGELHSVLEPLRRASR